MLKSGQNAPSSSTGEVASNAEKDGSTNSTQNSRKADGQMKKTKLYLKFIKSTEQLGAKLQLKFPAEQKTKSKTDFTQPSEKSPE